MGASYACKAWCHFSFCHATHCVTYDVHIEFVPSVFTLFYSRNVSQLLSAATYFFRSRVMIAQVYFQPKYFAKFQRTPENQV